MTASRLVKLVAAAGILTLALLAAGCNKQETSQSAREDSMGMEAASEPGAQQKSITIKGSDTEVNLVQRLAEEYMKATPGAQISVTGGGSGTGIAAVINKQTDIANSSRPMKDSEIEQARANGVEPVGIVFAMDGLAIIVNEGNPVSEMTIEQLGRIYSGAMTDWSETGGSDAEVSLYGRQSNSGTFVYFRDTVVKTDYSPKMKSMNGTAQIVEGVRQDPNGIGYVGIGYVAKPSGDSAKGIKVLKLAGKAGEEATSPLEPENVNSGKYPLSRPLYQYVNGKPSGDMLKFIQYELSPEGQKVIEGEGYYPVASIYAEQNKALGILP